jgi:hypothetical protein
VAVHSTIRRYNNSHPTTLVITFADLCSGWIRRFDPSSGMATGFATS